MNKSIKRTAGLCALLVVGQKCYQFVQTGQAKRTAVFIQDILTQFPEFQSKKERLLSEIPQLAHVQKHLKRTVRLYNKQAKPHINILANAFSKH